MPPYPNTSSICTCNFYQSIRDGYVLSLWKLANTCPIPRRTPPILIEKDVWQISLTSACSRKKRNDSWQIGCERRSETTSTPLQFENRRHASTTHMSTDLVHNWSNAFNGGCIVNVIFIDFTKAFSKVDHNILVDEYKNEKVIKLVPHARIFLQNHCYIQTRVCSPDIFRRLEVC